MAKVQTRRSISVRGATYDALAARSVKEQRAVSEIVEGMIADYLARREAEEGPHTLATNHTLAVKEGTALIDGKPMPFSDLTVTRTPRNFASPRRAVPMAAKRQPAPAPPIEVAPLVPSSAPSSPDIGGRPLRRETIARVASANAGLPTPPPAPQPPGRDLESAWSRR